MQAKNKKSLFFSKCAFLYTYTLAYIKSGRSSGGSIFEKFQGGALFLSFIAFLCDNFKNLPNFSGSQGGPASNTSPQGGLSQPPH